MKIIDFLYKLWVVIVRGGGKGVKRKRHKSRFLNALNSLDVWFFSLMDRIDTRFLFKGRAVRTRHGRVRSHYEKWISDILMAHGIRHVYEKRLVLEGKELHPDFYLPRYGVYIECWGLADVNSVYKRHMRLKKALYRRHGIRLISLYPRHFSNWRLERNLSRLFLRATGKKFPPRKARTRSNSYRELTKVLPKGFRHSTSTASAMKGGDRMQ